MRALISNGAIPRGALEASSNFVDSRHLHYASINGSSSTFQMIKSCGWHEPERAETSADDLLDEVEEEESEEEQHAAGWELVDKADVAADNGWELVEAPQ